MGEVIEALQRAVARHIRRARAPVLRRLGSVRPGQVVRVLPVFQRGHDPGRARFVGELRDEVTQRRLVRVIQVDARAEVHDRYAEARVADGDLAHPAEVAVNLPEEERSILRRARGRQQAFDAARSGGDPAFRPRACRGPICRCRGR